MQYFGNMLNNLVYKYADFKFFIPHNMATVDHFFSRRAFALVARGFRFVSML